MATIKGGPANPKPATAEEAGAVAPISLDAPASAQAPARLEPRPMFWLFHRPHQYAVIDGRVVPALRQWKLVPGVNGIGLSRDGKPIIGSAADELRRSSPAGAAIVPHDVDGPGTSYVRQLGPATYATRWERIMPGVPSPVHDAKGYAEWLVGLMDRGVLSRPTAFGLEVLREQAERDANNLASLLGHEPEKAEVRRRLDAIAAEQEALAKREASGGSPVAPVAV